MEVALSFLRSPFLLFPLIALALPIAHAGDAESDPVHPLIDLPAASWREHPPLLNKLEKHTGKEPLRLTVHYTDEPKNFDRPLTEKLRGLFNYSLHSIEGTKKALWGDIPYHFYIDAHGKLGECRNPMYQPDSNTTYDRDGHITIVVEGNNKDGITAPQKSKLFALLHALQQKYHVPMPRVGVHKDYAETDCPGDAVTAAVKAYKASHAAPPPESELDSEE
jgi:hypothetical protein